MARVPIALELYSVREDLATDLVGTLKRVKDMGYEGVEFAGTRPVPADELKGILDDIGLPCISWHTPLEWLQGDALQETIAYNKAIGNPSAICPWIGGDLAGSRANWLKAAALFNDIAARLEPHGMFTGYHNHHTEFTPVDGEWPWDTFFGNTGPRVVMQLDTGNAMHGGAEAVPILKRYPGRSKTTHLKPYSKNGGFNPVIGKDDTPWDEVFRICETTGGTEWYIVEYESDAYPPLEAVERCLKALKAMGK